jgi:hypothetical protein
MGPLVNVLSIISDSMYVSKKAEPCGFLAPFADHTATQNSTGTSETARHNNSESTLNPAETDETTHAALTEGHPHSSNDGGLDRDKSSSTNSLPSKQCRICLAGSEEEDSLGRLISPCKCKGTMKYVHLTCLQEWRRVSGKKESYYQCDQCKYKYRLSRMRFAEWLKAEGKFCWPIGDVRSAIDR